MIEQKLLVFKTIEALKEKGFLEPEEEILPIRDKNSIWNLIVMKCMHSSVKNEAIKIYTSWKRNYNNYKNDVHLLYTYKNRLKNNELKSEFENLVNERLKSLKFS